MQHFDKQKQSVTSQYCPLERKEDLEGFFLGKCNLEVLLVDCASCFFCSPSSPFFPPL